MLLGGFAIAAIGFGAGLAALIAARLTRPLEHLATAADRLGAGDFSTAVPPASGIPEIDGIGAALASSANSLDQMLTSERSFTGDVAHQLRTGLTGIGLHLDLLGAHADPAVRSDALDARSQVDRLSTTLDELLELARGGAGEQRVEVDLAVLIGHHVDDWKRRLHHADRVVDLHRRTTLVRATPGFVGQIVDILLDNAIRHGRGVIEVDVGERRVLVRDAGVVDHAPINESLRTMASPGQPHGRGLVLAQRLARADGGSLELRSDRTTTFELRYPEASHET
jgi:signal transduction histidine kinase